MIPLTITSIGSLPEYKKATVAPYGRPILLIFWFKTNLETTILFSFWFERGVSPPENEVDCWFKSIDNVPTKYSGISIVTTSPGGIKPG